MRTKVIETRCVRQTKFEFHFNSESHFRIKEYKKKLSKHSMEIQIFKVKISDAQKTTTTTL